MYNLLRAGIGILRLFLNFDLNDLLKRIHFHTTYKK